MFLFEPPPSQGDLHFRVLGFPVRVHPMFWLMTLIFGLSGGGEKTAPGELLAWVGVVFVSILVHELGHALVQRRYGGHPWITLHGMGGLASCQDCDRRPLPQILISLAGPLAGFALATVVLGALWVGGRLTLWSPGDPVIEDSDPLARHVELVSLGKSTLVWKLFPQWIANITVLKMLYVNIIWGLVNLLPVYPLDGGRASREVCMMLRGARGIDLSLWISIVVGGAMAAYAFMNWHSLYTALMFGYLALESYRGLQAYRTNRR